MDDRHLGYIKKNPAGGLLFEHAEGQTSLLAVLARAREREKRERGGASKHARKLLEWAT
jgi:hypothetical protein